MISYFCEVSTLWQVLLLVLSLLTVISLTSNGVLSFKYKYNPKKQFIIGVILFINIVLYVMMQIDSRITGAEHTLHLPYLLVFLVILSSLSYSVWMILSETKNRKTLGNNSIKEAFDNLPIGVCFFNEAGFPVLCNLEMHRFSFAVSGKDVQFITDLDDLLNEDFVPINGVKKEGKVFTVLSGKAWQLKKRFVTDENGAQYIKFVILDVTDLQQKRVKLTDENNQLRKAQEELKKLSANVVAVTREEEILNAKMRVHDEMGRSLIEARKYLNESNEIIPDSVVNSWKRAVSMLKYNNETDEEDMMTQIRKTCDTIGLRFIQIGTLPKEETAAYIITCAVRECVTNAVRYAQASELYADFSATENFATVTVTNNGKTPEGEITEGGGLSTLRKRVERAGGTMLVQSVPVFKLTVTVPKEKDGVIW